MVGACTEGPKGLASRQGKIPNPIESPLVRKGCATAAATRFFSMPGFLPEAGSTGIPSGQWCVCVVLALLHEREISASFEPGEAPAAVRGRPMTSEEVVLPENKLSPILLCCSPSLLGCWPSLCSLFRFRLTVFIPFWPHLSLAEIYVYWFGLVTPVTTVIGIVILVKRRRSLPTFPKVMAWQTITISVLANLFVLLGMMG